MKRSRLYTLLLYSLLYSLDIQIVLLNCTFLEIAEKQRLSTSNKLRLFFMLLQAPV